jgi:pimeloyl-ACP methyl ester carboxylesterase
MSILNFWRHLNCPLILTLLACAFAPSARAENNEGHRVLKIGDGTATAVFEAGLGDTLDVWRKVQSAVATQCARTLSYNRAGYPGSPASPTARDAQNIVNELRQELRSQGLTPPYILVGHSLGGLYMQYYARQYPQEVSGLVLVDSTHWDQLKRIQLSAPAVYAQIKLASLMMVGPMRNEFRNSAAAGTQVHASSRPSNIPTIVLSSSRAAPGETPAFRILMRRLQDDIAAEFAAQRHSFPLASGHYIQRDRPVDVIAAARELAGCR